jgi:hypothetical protein
MFPTIYAIAMDYLPVQTSSVPSERVFSSSSEMVMKKRNRISPILMESLQTLKFSLKKECLSFTQGWASSEKDMVYEMGPCHDGNDILAASRIESGGYDSILKVIAEDECDDIPDKPVVFEDVLRSAI